MAENKSRFVLLCQQCMAFGVVAALVAPAANLVSLDIVAPPSSLGAGGTAGVPGKAPGAASAAGTGTSVVTSRPIRPQVSTVPLRGVSAAGLRALGHRGRVAVGAPSGNAARLASADTSATVTKQSRRPRTLTVLSPPEPVAGLATVGVTWASGVRVPDQAIAIAVRTEQSGTWSTWKKVPYHQEEGPDPTSAEGRRAQPGTDPIYVGAVDDVQVRALTASGEVPVGMRLSLVNPGAGVGSSIQKPAIDTGTLHRSTTATTAAGDLSLSASGVTGKPMIYSRAQWGADERMRDPSSLHYGEVHAGFVHHTVNANGYTRAQVPAILRGIYAYHTQSRGWSDIGYNFLVDRFGRIWEGRYGGVDRPVVGAHTLGYNSDAFAMSAIGNYDTTQPSAAMLDAYARLFAWKLSLHGVRASSTRQFVTDRYLPAIDGHRDVNQTECPGRYLYAKIPEIRTLAAHYERSFASRQRSTAVAGSAGPVIVARDRATKQVFLIHATTTGTVGRVRATGAYFRHADVMLNAGDWNGDGIGDVVTRSGVTGLMYLYRGTSTGGLATPVHMSAASFAGVRLLTAVGDLTGDGHPDLLGQPSGGAMRIYPGTGSTGFRAGYVAHAALTAAQQLGVGLWSSDGSPDAVLRRTDGSLVLYPGNGPGGLTGGTRIGSLGTGYDWVVSAGDVTGDGRADLVVRSRTTGRLWLLPGSATGFGSRRTFATTDMRRFDLAG